jgi:hypothetical protein
MKRLTMSIILAALPLWTLEGVYGQDPGQPAKAATGWNQYQCPNHPEITASWPARCPKCGANLVRRGQPGRMMPYRSRAMEMRRRIMINTSIDVFDPEAILCAKRPLGLTREQIERLRAISMTARECAKEVLTDRQRRELNSLERLHNYPRTMAQMHRRMMQRMSSPEAMMSRMVPQQMMNRNTGRMADPQSDPEAGNLRGGSDFERVIPQNQLSDNMRDRLRDNLRDTYRDEYRDRLRDNLRDRYRDEYRDRFRDNFGFGEGFGNEGFGEGFGNEGFGFGNEGFGNEGFGHEGSGAEGFGREGFGEEGFGREGFGGNEGFGGGGERR